MTRPQNAAKKASPARAKKTSHGNGKRKADDLGLDRDDKSYSDAARTVKKPKKQQRAEALQKAKQWAMEQGLNVIANQQRGFAAVPGQPFAFVASAVPAARNHKKKKAMKHPAVPVPIRNPVAYVPPPPAAATASRAVPVPFNPVPHAQRVMTSAPMQVETLRQPPRARNTRIQAIQEPEEPDSDYETGDSDDDVYAARRAARQTTKARGKNGSSSWRSPRTPIWNMLTFSLASSAFLAAVGSLWIHGPTIAVTMNSVLMPPTRCFQSTSHDGLESTWGERCAMPAAAKRLLPCPPGGKCEGGELVSCGLDNVSFQPLVPKSNGMSCKLTPEALATVHTIHNRLQELSVASVCFEHPSIKVRSRGSSTSSSPMFDYFDLAQELQKGGYRPFDNTMTHETPSWLEFALKNKLVSGLSMEWKTKKTLLIGLSDESMSRLPLHASCLAQRKVVSTLESIKWAAWDIIVKWMVAYAWSLAWQPLLVWPLLVWLCRKFLLWVLRKAVMWALRQTYAKVFGKDSHARNDVEVKQLRGAIKRAMAEVLKGLLAEPTAWHRATSLRDIVKQEMYPDKAEHQARFCEKVWPLVVQAIASDERVGVRQQNGMTFWKWKGMRAQVY